MSRMSLDTAIRLSAEVKGGGNIDRVKRSLQDLAKGGQTTRMDMVRLEVATRNYARANDNTIAGIRSSIGAFRGLQEQAKIGSREFQRYGAEVQKLEAKLRGLDGTAEKAGASLGTKLAAGLAAAGIGRALQGITQQAASFDAEVRKAAAIEGGAGSFNVLRKEIEAVASVAAGTPVQVAALATAMSRAGFTADQTAKSLRSIVLGAEATDTAFDQMGSIVGTVLKTFQMDASQTAGVVDVMVKSANSANQTVTDVGEAMSYAAGEANTLGVSVEDTAATIALLADAGVRASRGGTTFATGLNRLQIAAGGADSEMQELIKGSAKMADAMGRLGADVLDVEGKLKPIDEVLIAIKRQMQGMSATDQAIISKALFGAEAGRGFQAVLARTEEEITKMFGGIRDGGGTAEETRKKMSGFGDRLVILGGAIDGVKNQIGGMIGAALKPLVDLMIAALGAAAKLPDPVKQFGAAAAAAGVTVLGLAVAVNALNGSLAIFGGVSGVKAAIAGLLSFKTAAALATKAAVALNLAVLGPWALVVAGLAAATAAAYKFNEPFKQFVDTYPGRFETFWKSIAADAEASFKRIEKAFDQVVKFMRLGVERMIADQREFQAENNRTAQLLTEGMKRAADSIGSNFSGVFDFIQDKWRIVVANMINYANPLTTLLTGLGINLGQAATAALDYQPPPPAPASWQESMFGGRGRGAVPPPPPVLPPPGGGVDVPTTGGDKGGSGSGSSKAEVAKGVKELLRLTDAEIAAAVNTAIGEYGGLDPRGRTDVFANILARSRSPQYPSNLVDVVTQPGQYAPNFGRSRSQVTDPGLYGRARFEQVKAELMNQQMLAQSIQDVDSRLYFKGISQQPNMVRGVDFLRAPDQNFFHGPGRSDPGRNPQITSQLLSELGGGGALTGYLDQQDQARKQREQEQAAANKQLQDYIDNRTKIGVQLNNEEDLLRATTDEAKRRLEFEIEIDEINSRNVQARNDLATIETEITRLGGVAETSAIRQRLEREKEQELVIARLKFEQEINDIMVERTRMMQGITQQVTAPTAFNELEQQNAQLQEMLEKYPAIGQAADAAADLATRGMAGMIAGTKSAKEVFVDFLNGIANALIDTAKRMIAQYIAIGIAKAFAGLGGAGGTSFAPGGQGGINPSLGFDPSGMAGDTGIPFFGRALGGGVSAGRPYPVGENGPELFVPYQAGTIIPAEATEALEAINNASLRGLQVPFQATAATASGKASQQGSGSSGGGLSVPFQRGMEGLSVPFQRGGMDGSAAAGGGSAGVIDVKFETVRIGELDFVTKDEAQRIGRESAKQGAALAQKRITNNPSTRRQAGIG
jgi:TP901 family phage tail tape measure protein